MVDQDRTASGRGNVPTNHDRAPATAGSQLLAGWRLSSLALIAALPTATPRRRPSSIQAELRQKRRRSRTCGPREVLTTRHQRDLEAHPHAHARDRLAAAPRGARSQQHAGRRGRSSTAFALATSASTSAIVQLRKQAASRQGVLAQRLVEIYKADQPDFVSVVLEADGFDDMLVRADYMSRDREAGLGDRRSGARAEAGVRAASGRCCSTSSSRPQEAVRRDRGQQRELARDARGDREQPGASSPSARRRQARQARQRDARSPGARGRHRARSRPPPPRSRASCRAAGPLPAGPHPPGQRRLHLAGQRSGGVAVRHALGAPARRRRHRGPGRHADPGRRQRQRRDGRLDGRLRPVHLHPARRRDRRPVTRTSLRSASGSARASSRAR